VDASPRLWAIAQAIGEGRRKADDSIRGAHQVRSNPDVIETMGSMGELQLDGGLKLIPDLYYCTPGGRKGCDAPSLGIDAKSFRFGANGSVNINKEHHDGLAQYGCRAYYVIATPLYGRRILIAKLVPYSDLDGKNVPWTIRRIYSDHYTLPWMSFRIAYVGEYGEYDRTIETDCFSRDEVMAHIDEARAYVWKRRCE
jgi:hypothetical protein